MTTIDSRITERMLESKGIKSVQLLQEINEGTNALPSTLHVLYNDGTDAWIKGENKINDFINSILASR